MSTQSPYFLVIDLEATCADKGAIPREETEIIEIGAVMVDGATLEAIDEFGTFVRPTRHPTLTVFCTQLTTITQQDVRGAPVFSAAIGALRRWIADRDALFCSWGDYDKNQFDRDARRWNVSLPLKGHCNLKRRFSEALGETRRYGMDDALARLGIPLAGTHHRGLDDARNIAKILPFALGMRPIPTPATGR